jgi:hypothetical protein
MNGLQALGYDNTYSDTPLTKKKQQSPKRNIGKNTTIIPN